MRVVINFAKCLNPQSLCGDWWVYTLYIYIGKAGDFNARYIMYIYGHDHYNGLLTMMAWLLYVFCSVYGRSNARIVYNMIPILYIIIIILLRRWSILKIIKTIEREEPARVRPWTAYERTVNEMIYNM